MGQTVTVVKGDVTEVFEDNIAHQIGNGAVQIVEKNGNQRIINNFDDVTVTLDEESTAKFAFDVAEMEAAAIARSQPADYVDEDGNDIDEGPEEVEADEGVVDGDDDTADKPQIH